MRAAAPRPRTVGIGPIDRAHLHSRYMNQLSGRANPISDRARSDKVLCGKACLSRTPKVDLKVWTVLYSTVNVRVCCRCLHTNSGATLDSDFSWRKLSLFLCPAPHMRSARDTRLACIISAYMSRSRSRLTCASCQSSDLFLRVTPSGSSLPICNTHLSLLLPMESFMGCKIVYLVPTFCHISAGTPRMRSPQITMQLLPCWARNY